MDSTFDICRGILYFVEAMSKQNPRTAPPIVWTLAGSDSGGGAGIQADLKTFQGLGVHGCSVVTAVTAQSTLGIRDLEPVSPRLVEAQLDALLDDLPPNAVKIGMLGDAETVRAVSPRLAALDVPVICDPVLASGTGTPLLAEPGRTALRDELLPAVDLLTPNLPEAEALLERALATDDAVEQAAIDLLTQGPGAVLITGGHRDGSCCQDYFTDGRRSFWINSPRQISAGSHGTGCVLSSAIAAGRAHGLDWADAIVWAKAYLNQGLREAVSIGAGNGPLRFGALPQNPEDMPWVSDYADTGRDRPQFPPEDPLPLGLYPVVDSLDWVKRLLPHRLRILQLRIKNPDAQGLESDIREAIQLARDTDTRLYINDHWASAIRYGAYGVHLGQDDLDPDALTAIEQAGLRLGVSTHSAFEVARALGCRPSYIALGTLFHTTSKVMDYEPLGLETFRRLRRVTPGPVVAIGGIHRDVATSVRDAGADGQAVISEITRSPDLKATLRAWADVYPFSSTES